MKTWIIALFALTLFGQTASAEPLIKANNLVYQGAFRVPVGDFGGAAGYGFSYGGGTITYNPANNSLFMTGHVQRQLVGEISIPNPVIPNSPSNPTNLNAASVIQNLSDITEGNMNNIGAGGADASAGNGTRIGGMLVYNGKLIGTSYAYYSTLATLSHFTSGLNLSTTGDFAGMYQVGTTGASFVDGWMSAVPAAYQTSLGGPALTGNGALSIISRTSYGPAAFSFDPDRLGIDSPVMATPLLYYPQAHATIGPDYGNTSPLFNGTTKIAGMTMVNGSRSVLFFGYHGRGQYDYGQWATDPIFADTCKAPDTCTTGPKGYPICADMNNCTTGRKGIPYDNDARCSSSGSDGCYYDPSGMGAKGPHAYPYAYQVWAYDSDDLAAVKAGTKNPWDVMPYATWTLPFDVVPTDLFGGAAAYDSATGRLFIVQPQGQHPDQYNKMPVVHVFQVNMSAAAASGYSIKPTVMLLNGSVTLKNNGGDDLVVTSASRTNLLSTTFANPVSVGGSYNVTVSSQPAGQVCTVINGAGTVDANNNVDNIIVTCNGAGPGADTTAPTTTPDKAAGRYTSSQTVSLSANETATIKYCLTAGCTPTTTYSAPFKTLQNIATQTLRYQSTDTAGNVEAVKETVLRKQKKK